MKKKWFSEDVGWLKWRRTVLLISFYVLFHVVGASIYAEEDTNNNDNATDSLVIEIDSSTPTQCIDTKRMDLHEKIKRYLVDDKTQVRWNLTIVTSNSVSHRLANTIFKKFVEELIGYQDIRYGIVQTGYNYGTNIQRAEDLVAETQKALEGMVNLEVWIPPGHSDNKGTTMENLGAQGTGGRFGWFVKANKEIKSEHILDHWRTYLNENITKLFSLTDEQLKQVVENYAKADDQGNFICEHENCSNGIFVPEKCETKICATLFVGDYYDTEFLMKQIETQKLLVQVAWIGVHLTPQFIELFREGAPILFYSWWPSQLSVIEGIQTVAFESCTELDLSNIYPTCRYELHTLRKVAWKKLKDIGTLAFEAVERFYLNDEDYREMLTEYNVLTRFDTSESLYRNLQPGWDEFIIQTIACDWLKNEKNFFTINTWKPTDFQEKPKLWFAGIFPLTNDKRYQDKTLAKAALMAINDINRNSSLLSNFELILYLENGGCSSDVVLFSFIQYIISTHLNMDHLVGILGPSCSDTVEPLAGVAKLLKTVMISYSAEGAIFNDQEEYPHFFRTIPENKLYRYVYLQLLQQLGWTRLASLTEDGNKYSEYLTLLQDVLQPENINLHNRKFPREARKAMATYLRTLKDLNYRIIIGDFYAEMACEIMCESYHLEMTAKQGFIWFLPRWFEKQWYDIDSRPADSNKFLCKTEDMLKALDGHFSLGYAYYASDKETFHSGNTISQWKERYLQEYETLADYAGYTYDAVWTYAFALDKLLDEKITHAANMHSTSTNNRFVELLQNTDFMGVSGHISFEESSSRKTTINIMQFRANYEERTGDYHIVGQFFPTDAVDGGDLFLNESAIKWLTPEGQKPGDGSIPPSTCALEPFSRLMGVNCEVTIVITMFIAFFGFAAIMLILFVVYRMK